MDFWLIRDGEKTGPLHDFEIRRKIEDGELPASTPAWHDGLSGWKPLIEIEIFTREFELAAKLPAEEVISPAPDSPKPPPLPVKIEYGRRFWARWLDLTLYAGFYWLGMWAAGQNIEAALFNPWTMFLRYVPWFVVETLLIHRFATTPGKWLLGLQVFNKDGSRLTLGQSTRRSLRVLFTGIGFGWDILAIFCQTLSFFTTRRLGNTLWDYAGGHVVSAAPLNPYRTLTLVFLFFGAIQMQLVVISPYVLEMAGKTFPSIKAENEKNPPWHLPKRH